MNSLELHIKDLKEARRIMEEVGGKDFTQMDAAIENAEYHLNKAPSEPSTLPVVDYEKEIADLTNSIYFEFFPNGRYTREPIIKSIKEAIIRARQMSPSDTNGKVKELIEYLIEVEKEYQMSTPEAFVIRRIISKANSLIQPGT